jgi:hypothetical protein
MPGTSPGHFIDKDKIRMVYKIVQETSGILSPSVEVVKIRPVPFA